MNMKLSKAMTLWHKAQQKQKRMAEAVVGEAGKENQKRKRINKKPENPAMDQIDACLNHLGITHYRNNTGAIMGAAGYPVKFGLCVGSSDYIGYMPIKITPEMVGKTVAVFLAVEAKAPGKKATKDQREFLDGVKAAGGCAFVSHSYEETKNGITGYKNILGA